MEGGLSERGLCCGSRVVVGVHCQIFSSCPKSVSSKKCRDLLLL